MSKLILGLDVSTSVTGVCIVDKDVQPDDKGSHILLLDKIEFKKCKTFWEKADVVQSALSDILHKQKLTPTVLALEEPLLGFQKGMSSATTITTLMRFNGIVSYIGRRIFETDPTYISAAHARKLCGIKMQRTSIAGMNGKEQVFKYMSENDLKHVDWPKKKNGAPIDASRDMTDAYVIARAACLL
jgi:Holliday junction resolvasome RuvABC endonuclease subunit